VIRTTGETKNGEEDETAAVDEERRADAQDARAGEDKNTVIASKLKRSVGATYQQAMRLGVILGGGRKGRA